METKFTKGPWLIEPSKRGESCVTIGTGKRAGSEWHEFASVVVKTTDEIYGEATPDDEGAANAHLIAASPDLYEALEAIVRAWGNEAEESVAHRKAEAVLARARGEQP